MLHGQAHVHHFLHQHRFDQLRRDNILPRRNREHRVEIRGKGGELDADRGLELILGLCEVCWSRELPASHRAIPSSFGSLSTILGSGAQQRKVGPTTQQDFL